MRYFKLARMFCFLILFSLAACSETPDGTIIMNEETIENFLEGDRQGLESYNPPLALNLLRDQPVMKAAIPPLKPGFIRLWGTLNSVGEYKTSARPQADFPGASLRGSSFTSSVYGMLGDAGNGGTAWVYVDIDDATGQITAARAYMYGFLTGVCDMRDPAQRGFGNIGQDKFTLTIDGPCLFPNQPGSTSTFALVIEGAGSLLKAKNGASFPVKYIIDNNGEFNSIPADPRAIWNIFDYGEGLLHITR